MNIYILSMVITLISSSISILAILINYPESRNKKKLAIAAIILILFVNFAGILYTFSQYKIDIYSKESGKISSTNNVIYPDLRFGPAIIQGYPKINIQNTIGGIVADPVTVVVENGKLKVSLVIRDIDGNILVNMDKNNWKTNNAIFDRNFNSEALEVLDSKGNVVLQCRVKE